MAELFDQRANPQVLHSLPALIFDEPRVAEYYNDLDNGLAISEREDARFKYLDIKAPMLNNHELIININQGMVDIENKSKIEKREKSTEHEGYFMSMSSFHQRFNVPSGVDEKSAEVIHEKDGIVIKFLKFKIDT